MKKKLIQMFSVTAVLIVLFAFSIPKNVQQEPWIVPDEYKELKNTVEASKSSISAGKLLYMQHCKSCHGKEGLGDGSKAAQLETPCGDFTSDEFQEQSDGELFYKTRFGRGDMPEFGKKIPSKTDTWNIVNYMRTLE